MPKPMLIGLCGYKQVGKDTVAEHLVKMYGFQRRAFADKLKEAVANLFDIDPDDVDMFKEMPDIRCGIFNPTRTDNVHSNHYTMRQFLQRFGTEMGRKTFHEDFWINMLFSHPFYKDTVITDCRFPNELRTVKEHNGKVVRVVRMGYGPDGHTSELPPPDHLVDYTIVNDGDLLDLYPMVEEMMEALFDIEREVV